MNDIGFIVGYFYGIIDAWNEKVSMIIWISCVVLLIITLLFGNGSYADVAPDGWVQYVIDVIIVVIAMQLGRITYFSLSGRKKK